MANVHMLRETKLIKIVKISLFLSKNCLLQVKKIAEYPAKSVSSSSLLKTILNVTYFLCYLNPPPPPSLIYVFFTRPLILLHRLLSGSMPKIRNFSGTSTRRRSQKLAPSTVRTRKGKIKSTLLFLIVIFFPTIKSLNALVINLQNRGVIN